MSDFSETHVNPALAAPTAPPVSTEAIAPDSEAEATDTQATADTASEGAPGAVTSDSTDPEEALKKDPKFGPRFAALAKQERKIKERERSLKAQTAEVAEYRAALADAKTNPMKLLERHGLSFEKLVDYVLTGDKAPTTDQRVEEIQSKITAYERMQKEQLESNQKAQVEQTIQKFKGSIQDFITTNSETYELIQANEAQDMVYDVIEEYFKATQKVLPTDKAAEQVETYLFNEGQKLLKTKKFAPQSTGNIKSERTEVKANPSRTLTNSQIITAQAQPAKRLTIEESKRKTAAWLQEQLNKK